MNATILATFWVKTRLPHGRRHGTSRGFTLVEALIGITIFMFALVGPLVVIQRGLISAYQAKDSLIASFLAQEGMEAVRAIRDHNAIYRETDKNWPWLAGLLTVSDPECDVILLSPNVGCTIDVRNMVGGLPQVFECPTFCPPMRVSSDTSNPAYGYNNSWPVSMFTRVVQVTETEVNKEALVSVIVSWNSHGQARQLLVQNTLFKW